MDGSVGIDRPGDGAPVRRFSHEAMATIFEVHVAHADAPYAAQAAHAAFDLVDRIERELSRFLPNSDIGRINGLAAGEASQVSPATLECLLIARHMYDLTGGAFDISIGTGLPALELDADACLVRPLAAGLRLDLGGIGKGYAVDLAAELLEEWGLERALVHGGFSSVLALEPATNTGGWPLTLSDPSSPGRILSRLEVRQTAFGASGLRKGDHIVDPRTGQPAGMRRAAWVAVPRPPAARAAARAGGGPQFAATAVADALTTAFMLMRPEEIGRLCDGNPGLRAWTLESTPEGAQGGSTLRCFGDIESRRI
jgi:thiamine biosynthesis lipoprotein